MIIVRLTSGLGNQMFQYSFCKLLQERYPSATVKADTRWLYRNDPHHGFELTKVFPNLSRPPLALQEAGIRDCFRVTGQIYGCPKNKMLAKVWGRFTGGLNRRLREGKYRDRYRNNMIDDSTGAVDDLYQKVMNLDPQKDYYIISYWASEKYYKERSEKIQKEFAFDEPKDQENQKMLARIDGSDSVSIHIRRGDYLLKENADKFKALGMEYYGKAIAYIEERVANPTFFVFSDDIAFAKELFADRSDMVYVSHNTGINSFRDMQLMSRCKHNITANSTFSIWAGILNKNAGHLTIYPAAYMYGEDTEEKTLPDWIRIS